MINGNFNSFNGTPCGNLLRLNLDGTIDTNFIIGTGADDRIWNAQQNPPGGLWAGSWDLFGAFQSFNGSPRQCLASLNADGSLNNNYASFTIDAQGYDIRVNAISPSPQGTYLAGSGSGYGGKFHRRVARFNNNGSPDRSFRGGLLGTAVVTSISSQNDGKLLLAGHFGMDTSYVGCTSLVRLLPDGTMDLDFRPDTDQSGRHPPRSLHGPIGVES